MLQSFTNSYRRKIKTVDELRAIIGPFPRDKKVIMCHGVFDLVHPGHVRHLIYVKEHADIIVASITCDEHVTKAQYRPFVSQDLRALNLAAFEMVDYVIIDHNPTPLENIAKLQPDYFAKGYEYSSGKRETKKEIDALKEYGGEILYTPGDIRYSSSHLIENSPPNISLEKLLLLMEGDGLSFKKLRDILCQCEGKRVHVVGDTIVDRFSYTTMIGGMGKTPTPSVKFENSTDYIGGAAIVAKHLRAAGADVTFSTVLGADKQASFVLESLESVGIKCFPIIDRTRVTTEKNAFICDNYRLLKVDTLDNRIINDEQAEEIATQIRETPTDAVIFSDFRHGTFNRTTIPVLTQAIPQGVYRVADSQVASRWGNILDFKGFDLITPNEKEARFALADQDSGIRPLSAKLHEEAQCKTLILKLGERGILGCKAGSLRESRSVFVVDSFADNVIDAVGAGDALLAYTTLSMLVDPSESAAAILGSIAAALECEVDGNQPVSCVDVLKRLDTLERQAKFQ